MRIVVGLVALSLVGLGAVWAQPKGVPGKEISSKDVPLPPSQYDGKPLPELKGVVSWKTLAQVEPVKQKDRFVPQFSNNIAALDKKEVDQLVEVQAKAPVKYGFDPIILSGRFQVLRDDPMGLYYRLVDAVPISQ